MSSVRLGLRPMKTWRMNGSDDLAVAPSEALLVGTVRQPSRTWPSDWTICPKSSSSRRRMVAFLREKNESAAILARAGQGDAGLFARVLEKTMGHLQQHAGAIARVGFAAAGAAVVEILQDLERLQQNLVGLAAFHVHDKADAAGIVLKLRIVKSLLGRPAGHFRMWRGVIHRASKF